MIIIQKQVIKSKNQKKYNQKLQRMYIFFNYFKTIMCNQNKQACNKTRV